jgi:glycosyltransferase involved in cell wall biosynthesis
MRMEQDVHVWAAWAGFSDPIRRFLATFQDPSMVRAFEQVLERSRPDLVHVQHLMGLPTALIHAIQRSGLPYVVTLWDFWWICANAQLLTNFSQQICDGPRAYMNCARCVLARAGVPQLWPALPPLAGLLAWRNRLLRQVLEMAGGLIAPTEFVRHWYAEHGVPARRLFVMPPAMEQTVTASHHRRSSDGPVRFAYIGGLSWQKGVHCLIDAFGEIDGLGELWIAGDESFDPAYVSRVRAQATDGVRFLGRLTRDQVWDTLAQIDVVVAPSLWYETFSFLVSEAFVAGVPVVASRLGPLADRVRDGVDGLLVPPGDVAAWRAAMRRLVEEPGLLAHLRSNVRSPLTLEEHVDRLETLYTQLIAGNSKA